MIKMAIRPKPSEKYLFELCGGRQGLLQAMHHGLYETPLNNFYPFLDLEEMLVFAASSWKAREQDITSVRQLITFSHKPEIFCQTFEIGDSWLYKWKNLSPESKTESEILNPFKRKNVVERLSQVREQDWMILTDRMSKMVNEYVFGYQYNKRFRQRGGDFHGLELMDFQSYYPSKKHNSPKFAKEIARILADYPEVYAEPDAESKFVLPVVECVEERQEDFSEYEGKSIE